MKFELIWVKFLKSEIEYIEPELFRNEDRVSAYFSLKNPALFSGESRNISGLNLGLNTDDSEKVIEGNRHFLLESLGIQTERIAYADQVHGTRIQEVTEAGTCPETDALITRMPGLALAIQVADCAAVLLADPENRVVGAVHAGWRGAAGDIVPSAIEKMKEAGAEPAGMKAFVSPCISRRHFEVGPEVAELFPGKYVDYESFDKPHINLKAFLEYQLIKCGLSEGRIEVHAGCTVADSNSYYSYRREKERSGRMMGIISLKGEN